MRQMRWMEKDSCGLFSSRRQYTIRRRLLLLLPHCACQEQASCSRPAALLRKGRGGAKEREQKQQHKHAITQRQGTSYAASASSHLHQHGPPLSTRLSPREKPDGRKPASSSVDCVSLLFHFASRSCFFLWSRRPRADTCLPTRCLDQPRKTSARGTTHV
jgi:hypothetical protein